MRCIAHERGLPVVHLLQQGDVVEHGENGGGLTILGQHGEEHLERMGAPLQIEGDGFEFFLAFFLYIAGGLRDRGTVEDVNAVVIQVSRGECKRPHRLPVCREDFAIGGEQQDGVVHVVPNEVELAVFCTGTADFLRQAGGEMI